VFDLERDDDHGARRFYLRLLTIAAIALAACVVIYPSVKGFQSGEDDTTTCIAITNGFHADMAPPSAADRAAIEAAAPQVLTPEQARDPALLARFRAQSQAAQALPARQRANAYFEWQDGPGQCVHESRHRLILSGIGLGAIALGCAGAVTFRRARKNLRRAPAELAGT
jgi:hypothetical protein